MARGRIKGTLKGIVEYHVILLVLSMWITEQYIGTFSNCLSVWYISYEADMYFFALPRWVPLLIIEICVDKKRHVGKRSNFWDRIKSYYVLPLFCKSAPNLLQTFYKKQSYIFYINCSEVQKFQ